MKKHLLLTGASGNLGRLLTRELAARGYQLRLSDIVPFPDPVPAGCEFHQADLADAQAVAKLVQGTDCVLHFGGISVEKPYAGIIEANVLGTTHIFEAVRSQRQRVVFASSNHTIGFHERSTPLNSSDVYRPDGYYGLSKAWGELLGSMMFDKHGVESVHLRIGSCLPAPTEARHLATWLSHDDLLRLVCTAVEAPETGYAIVWGASANSGTWWRQDDAARIGYFPEDNAAHFGKLPEVGDAIAQRFQGGSFTAIDYSKLE